MRVTFLLPTAGSRPSGGFKVVYEYANALTVRGHDVTVIHPAFLSNDEFDCALAIRNGVLGYAVKGALGYWRPTRWFSIDPRVRMLWVPSLKPSIAPDADVIVATWWRTAEMLADWPDRKGRKFYLVQHFETWGGPEQRVLATWRLPFVKIVIARWLEQAIHSLGEHCHYVPNGLNFAAFGVDTPPAERPAPSAAMLYHEYDWKGSADGLAALRIAKSSLPDLRAELFGTCRAPVALPGWISYHRNPRQSELRAIYNRSAIFVSPSWAEGWPLPPAEALMCGCALACTDIGGHNEYAIRAVTALTSLSRDPVGLAENIVRLVHDAELRLKLSAQGYRFIRQFTWQVAADRFAAVLKNGDERQWSGAGGDAEQLDATVSQVPFQQ